MRMVEAAKSQVLSRRRALRMVGLALGSAPLFGLIACSSSDAASNTGTAGGSGAAGSAGSGGSAGSAGTAGTSGDGGAWATGGTASMSGDYADPFTTGLGTTCVLTCEMTQGPCYDADTVERKDISEGQLGLPMRLALLIVDESCKPIEGATVDIWHTAATGVYSGNDTVNENVQFCTGGDAAAIAAKFFRGVQTTDANGRVDFDSCFPGWYASRTIHIHFIVRVGGNAYVTAQLFFEDALDDEIVATQPIYSARGARDTTNATDTVSSGASASDYILQTAKQADGALLAWKTLVIRSSLSEASCSVGGGMGGPV